MHDIGLRLFRNDAGEAGFEVLVGGGQGRTPMIAKTIRRFVPKPHLLSYLEAVMRVYNLLGRRDNMYKARIKILVHEMGAEAITEMVEAEWRLPERRRPASAGRGAGAHTGVFRAAAISEAEGVHAGVRRGATAAPGLRPVGGQQRGGAQATGYAIVNLSLKPEGGVPGDATAEQMDAVAELAERYSFGEIRVTHEQNLVLADVTRADLAALWRALDGLGLATPNVGLLTDIIACPGLDYCGLANTRSIPIAQRISRRFGELDRLHDIGELHVNISGCHQRLWPPPCGAYRHPRRR